MGGLIPFFSVLAIFLLLALIVFAMLSYRSQLIIDEMKELRDSIYEDWEDKNEQ